MSVPLTRRGVKIGVTGTNRRRYRGRYRGRTEVIDTDTDTDPDPERRETRDERRIFRAVAHERSAHPKGDENGH